MHGCVLLGHAVCERVVCRELWQSVGCLVHHYSSVWRTSCATCHAEWAPISVWHVGRVVQHPRGIRRRFRSSQGSWCLCFTRIRQLSRLICVGDCSPVAISSFSRLRRLITITREDFLVHVSRHVFSSHHHRFAMRHCIRQRDSQVRKTIVRHQIHSLVPQMMRRRFSADVLRSGWRTLTSNVTCIKNLSAVVTCPYTTFCP